MLTLSDPHSWKMGTNDCCGDSVRRAAEDGAARAGNGA